MKSFNLEIFKGHAIIRDADNIILVDTGAPRTVNQTTSFLFAIISQPFFVFFII
jgi:hypothetical protein